MRVYLFVSIVTFLMSTGCSREADDRTRVTCIIEAAYHKKIYLQQVPLNNETRRTIDSVVVQTGRDSFVFYIPPSEQRLYNLHIAGTGVNLRFVNDSRDITLRFNYATGKYTIGHSPVSSMLQDFIDSQQVVSKSLRKEKLRIDSMITRQAGKKIIQDSIAGLNRKLAAVYGRYREFADTVKSPAAFLAVYNYIDYGNDYAGLKAFITRAAKRFPNHAGVQQLKNNVLEYLQIFEKEFNPGDTLPELVLPDTLGLNFSTYSLKGKYMLLDFWSTWCDPCLPYLQAKKQASQTFPPEKFQVVSVALDEDKQSWLTMIKKQHLSWNQLIDEKMWNGSAVKTLYFDSIPFNFLVDPKGIVIAKAIKADSLLSVISGVLKK